MVEINMFNEKVDDGYACWLRYPYITDDQIRQNYSSWLSSIVADRQEPLIDTAVAELIRGTASLIGEEPQLVEMTAADERAVLIASRGQHPIIDTLLDEAGSLNAEGYLIRAVHDQAQQWLVIAAESPKGCLYGVFHLLRLLQVGTDVSKLDIAEQPVNELRMINHWDNMDGSIERGYAGKSIFYSNNEIVKDLSRIQDYARLLASIGINAITLNNVNVHEVETRLIDKSLLPEVAGIADILRKYGIQTFLSINYASPIQLGGLPNADPLDSDVRNWWAEKAKEIVQYIPDFGGVVVKADSEFRPGPFTYGRNHADGANMLGGAFGPVGGLVIWRCFVYNCLQDWRDRSTDRARAAYDHFKPLDGQFLDNVILQIKNGPVDFQVREPVSPLFGGMKETNQVLELQITQEYTGQQRHVCYLVPQWKEVLDFDTYAQGEGSTVAHIVDGSLFNRKHAGFAAVSNIGDDRNWTGHVLAQANWYGYARLAWNPGLETAVITDEWVRLTFGNDEQVVAVVTEMLHKSWSIYESYTAPLGVGWMVNPEHHYGPNVDGYEYAKWGTYHFADCHGIGVDRTKATGTGYAAQYHSPQFDRYESLESCPDELLLFFHHVPYTHVLHSGKTVIQHIYDTHIEGVEQAEQLVADWQSLDGRVNTERYEHVLGRLQEQAAHAKEWRDVINTYFYRKSGINDQHNRHIYA